LNHFKINNEKAIIISFIFLSLHILAQSANTIKFTTTNRISDTLVIRGANTFQQNPINAKQQFEAIFEAPKGSYNLSNGREATTLYLNLALQ
jgi:hypothetical protein